MALNFPGPYELRMAYTTEPISGTFQSHTQRLNLDLTAVPTPGDAFSNIQVIERGGVSNPDLATAVEAWLALIDGVYFTTTVFNQFELWQYTPLTFEATFISSYSPTIVAGVNVTATGKAQQDIITFRTVEGGILRVNFMNAFESVYTKVAASSLAGSYAAIKDFVQGSTNWILARDTSYPFSALNFLRGQNEKLFRDLYR